MSSSCATLRTKSRAALVALLATLCVLWVPAPALAGQDTIFNGWMDAAGRFGPRHSLTSVWTTWYQGDYSCVNALNTNNTWAGTSFCAGPGDVNVGHPYCGCTLRYGWGGALSGWTDAYTRQFW